MPKLGLYLQGLKEARGFSTLARDEAEGRIGQLFLRSGPKEAQDWACTSEPERAAPHLTPTPKSIVCAIACSRISKHAWHTQPH